VHQAEAGPAALIAMAALTRGGYARNCQGRWWKMHDCIATTPEVTIHADGEEMVFGGPG
jgi:hypothetical protein